MIDLLRWYGYLFSTFPLNNTPFNCIIFQINVDRPLPIKNVIHCLGLVLPALADDLKIAVFFGGSVVILELACEILQGDDGERLFFERVVSLYFKDIIA